MKENRPILSEKPEDFEKAVAWGREEKERILRGEEDSRLLCEELKPFVMHMLEKEQL